MKIGLLSLVFSLSLVLAGTGHSRDHVLLIGASHYSDPALNLRGPVNDVALLERVLRKRGIPAADIRVLAAPHDADSPDLAPRPRATRANIIEAFERLVDVASPGDTVYIHMSGHGTQQPDQPGGDEADGLDEVFLPEDIGRWDQTRHARAQIPNALIDDEIGQYLERIRSKGALVWIVLDTCHSGSGTRNVGTSVITSRYVSPGQLGLPPRSPVVGEGDSTLVEQSPGIVAFFAASSRELALEAPLPVGDPNAQVHGLLTFAIAEALSEPGATRYRDIANRILTRYDRFRGKTPVPIFEGDLDRAALGDGRERVGPNRFVARKIIGKRQYRLEAGRFNGLRPDSVLTLQASDGTDVDADYVIERIGPDQSVVTVQSRNGGRLPKLLWTALETSAQPDPLGVLVTVASDIPSPLEDKVRTLIAEAPGLVALSDDRVPDLRVHLAPSRIHLTDSFDTERPPFSNPHKQAATVPIGRVEPELPDMIARFVRRAALDRALRHVEPRRDAPLRLERFVERLKRVDGLCPAKPDDRTPPQTADFVDETHIAALNDCDRIYLKLTNAGNAPLDVTGFYENAQGLLRVLKVFRGGLRLEPGESYRVSPLTLSSHRRAKAGEGRDRPLALGAERIIFLAVSRSKGADLSFVLNFDALATTRGNPAGMDASRLEALFEKASDPSASAALFRWISRAGD